MMEYRFDGREMGDYCPVEFTDTGHAVINRGAVLTEEQYGRLTDESKAHVKAWVRAGVVTARDDTQPKQVARVKRGEE